MTRRPISTEALEAVRRCFERYGADPERWPEADRAAYAAYADAEELGPVRAEAAALDGFLGAASAPRMDEGLERRMLADFDALGDAVSDGIGADTAPAASAMTGRGLSGLRAAVAAALFDLGAGARLAAAGISAGAFAAAAALGVVAGVVTADGASALAPETEAYAYLVDASPFLYDDEAEAAQ